MRWKMKPVKNRFHLDFPVSLQEEFVPSATLRGSSTGVVAGVESLRVPVLWGRGRMEESERQVEGLSPEGDASRFESLLAEAFS